MGRALITASRFETHNNSARVLAEEVAALLLQTRFLIWLMLVGRSASDGQMIATTSKRAV